VPVKTADTVHRDEMNPVGQSNGQVMSTPVNSSRFVFTTLGNLAARRQRSAVLATKKIATPP
jgi:hypothetical protein